MTEGYHIIQRHVFDISYAVREKAYALQSRFSRLFDREGKAVLQEVADRVIPDSVLLRLEELEVDLGHIPQDRLEKEFPVRLKEELEAGLLRVMQEHGRGSALDRNRSLAGLLEHFLLTGSLPWWAAGALLNDPITVVEQLIKDNAEDLKKVLISTGQRDQVRRRLIRQFPEATIRAMVVVLEPDEASFIFVYASDIVELQERGPSSGRIAANSGKVCGSSSSPICWWTEAAISIEKYLCGARSRRWPVSITGIMRS